MAFSQHVFTTATTLAELTPPLVPTGLTASAGSDRVILRWTASPGADSYAVEMREGSGPWGEAYAGSATQTIQSGLTPDTEYTFRVKATNTAGSSDWAEITVRTTISDGLTRIIRLTGAAVVAPAPERFITVG